MRWRPKPPFGAALSTIEPQLRIFSPLGLNGQFLAVWLAHTGYGLPFAIYLLRNYMGGLPREVFESAAIDGASPATAFFRLALPMSVPAIALPIPPPLLLALA